MSACCSDYPNYKHQKTKNRKIKCRECGGNGRYNEIHFMLVCPKCNGKGYIQDNINLKS